MIRKTDPEGIPRNKREEFDVPPCVMDEGHGGDRGEPDDPLYDERHGTPTSHKHAMHDGEKEK